MDDTETRIAGEINAVLARHRVLEHALLQTIRALPPEAAARLAQELRACANRSAPVAARRQVTIRPWSFMRQADAESEPVATPP